MKFNISNTKPPIHAQAIEHGENHAAELTVKGYRETTPYKH